MSLRARKNLPVGSSISSWAGAPAILDATALPSRIDTLNARSQSRSYALSWQHRHPHPPRSNPPSHPLYWNYYGHNNQISVVIEPGASHLSKQDNLPYSLTSSQTIPFGTGDHYAKGESIRDERRSTHGPAS